MPNVSIGVLTRAPGTESGFDSNLDHNPIVGEVV